MKALLFTALVLAMALPALAIDTPVHCDDIGVISVFNQQGDTLKDPHFFKYEVHICDFRAAMPPAYFYLLPANPDCAQKCRSKPPGQKLRTCLLKCENKFEGVPERVFLPVEFETLFDEN